MADNEYISLAEYARLHGVDAATVRQKILRGNLPGAVKIGRNWAIPKNIEYTDMRRKTEMRTYEYSGKIYSRYGFYIGDPAYALDDHVYHDLWGTELNWAEGRVYTKGMELPFAVARTGIGDGTFRDENWHEYNVDSGTIALIPFELVEKGKACRLGAVVQDNGYAEFEFKDGRFYIKLPNGTTFNIKTNI